MFCLRLCPVQCLILPTLKSPGRNLVRFNDVYHGSPAGRRIPIEGIHQALTDNLEQFLRFQILPPECLTHAKKVLLASARDTKVVGNGGATYKVEGANVWFVCLLVQSSDNGFNEIGTETALVEEILHHSHQGLGPDTTSLSVVG